MTTGMVSGFSNTTVGEKTITVTYGGKTTTFKITVTAEEVTGIRVKTVPSKTSYIKGQNQVSVQPSML